MVGTINIAVNSDQLLLHPRSARRPYPSAAVGEHLETYLRWVFGFIGIKNPEFISADGIQVGPEHREKAVAGALKAAGDLNAA
jgi:FMN-dependent NADH-azoreductase